MFHKAVDEVEDRHAFVPMVAVSCWSPSVCLVNG